MTSISQWMSTVTDLDRLDCERLLTHTLDVNRAYLLTHPDLKLECKELQQLQHFCAELRKDVPLAYVLGEQGFWDVNLHVAPGVLIPRPETETLVELCVELTPANGRLLDLGTGSGAIAIAVARERSDIAITACDVSKSALDIAQLNALNNNAQITFEQSDWFANLAGQWDVIVSNPPYIAEGDPHLPALQAEPTLALVSGRDGLDAITHITTRAPEFLATGGYLVFEHGYNQATEVRTLMRQSGFVEVRSVHDLSGIERATLGRYRTSHSSN